MSICAGLGSWGAGLAPQVPIQCVWSAADAIDSDAKARLATKTNLMPLVIVSRSWVTLAQTGWALTWLTQVITTDKSSYRAAAAMEWWPACINLLIRYPRKIRVTQMVRRGDRLSKSPHPTPHLLLKK